MQYKHSSRFVMTETSRVKEYLKVPTKGFPINITLVQILTKILDWLVEVWREK